MEQMRTQPRHHHDPRLNLFTDLKVNHKIHGEIMLGSDSQWDKGQKKKKSVKMGQSGEFKSPSYFTKFVKIKLVLRDSDLLNLSSWRQIYGSLLNC